MAKISRKQNNDLFGPTVGDKIRLADTNLYVEIEKDLRYLGDENVYGGGKTLRDGMGLANTIRSEGGSLDFRTNKKSHTALAVWDENSAVPPKFSTKRQGFCGLFLLLCNGSARL